MSIYGLGSTSPMARKACRGLAVPSYYAGAHPSLLRYPATHVLTYITNDWWRTTGTGKQITSNNDGTYTFAQTIAGNTVQLYYFYNVPVAGTYTFRWSIEIKNKIGDGNISLRMTEYDPTYIAYDEDVISDSIISSFKRFEKQGWRRTLSDPTTRQIQINLSILNNSTVPTSVVLRNPRMWIN